MLMAYLCEVRIWVAFFRFFSRTCHSMRLATASIPVVGSSRNTTGGSPIKAIAVESFLLLPPLKKSKTVIEIVAITEGIILMTEAGQTATRRTGKGLHVQQCFYMNGNIQTKSMTTTA